MSATARTAGPARDTAAVRARLALAQALPRLDGGRLEVKLVEVTYGPGGSSPPHRHPCAVAGYVVSGALRMQVSGRPAAIYRAGESFYEGPDDVHQVSANASDTESATFVVTFVCDHQTPLTVAVPESHDARGR
jgi:quercetin dioxygenase-like cupin family protein